MEPIQTKLRHASLCLTHACNLRCRYCYAGEKSDRSMSMETAVQALRFIADHAEPRCLITFFGGEPLLRYDLLREIVAHCRCDHPDRFHFRFTTNGTLLDRDKILFCRDNQISLDISLDGTEAQHDMGRPDVGGRGSYQSIRKCLPDLLEILPSTPATSTIHPETAHLLADGVIDLFRVGFRYVAQSLDYAAQWEESHVAILQEQYLRLADYYAENLLSGAAIYYSPFEDHIRTWTGVPFRPGHICEMADTEVVIAASGRIYPCVQFVGADDGTNAAFCLGDVFSGFDATRRAEIVQGNNAPREDCEGCALLGRCANYCGCANWKSTGRLNRVPPILCAHEQMLIPIADAVASRLWKENKALFEKRFAQNAVGFSRDPA